jgi:glutamate synthase domain-containing protein 3
MDSALALRRKEAPATLSAIGRFGAFKPETEHPVREQEVKTDPALEMLKRAWKAKRRDFDPAASYPGMLEHIERIRGLEYSAKDIEAFSITMAQFQDEEFFPNKAGFFLSALINSCQDDRFIIHTKHLDRPIHSLGINNTKIILVKGDVGTSVGSTMTDGRITVEGNADSMVGIYMKGGVIVIKGDAVSASGDCVTWLGEYMTGGEIRVHGDYDLVSENIIHGKIYHKRRLLIDK